MTDAWASGDGGSRTIFVGTLPINATSRELYLFFSTCPGYQACNLVQRGAQGKNPLGFVMFDTPDHARAAVAERNGWAWDPEAQYRIKLEPSNREMQPEKDHRQQQGLIAAPPLTGHKRTHEVAFPYDPRRGPPTAAPPHFHAYPGMTPMGVTRTIHINEIGLAATQEDLQGLCEQTWGDEVVAINFHGGPSKHFAFVCFRSPHVAAEAVSQLNGLNWLGSNLQCSFAKREMTEVRQMPPQQAAIPPTVPVMPRTTPGAGGASRSTLRVTGLPAGPVHELERDLKDFIQTLIGPGQLVGARAQVKGTKAQAFVGFTSPEAAVAAMQSFEHTPFFGQQIRGEYAHRDYEPSQEDKKAMY
eukprot:TRINITY_DN12856_c0_g1_i1.p1 TRINITY_DN12856_c0_g1~~TRINITY_DN12856_c0_g1_i1.p1  ORF type:complete len:358 (+),score=74.43 TRINITY_DN12856_c0_g1_i1:79-1152(+)